MNKRDKLNEELIKRMYNRMTSKNKVNNEKYKGLSNIIVYNKKYNCKSLVKSSVSLSKLLIVCGKKIYVDVLFDPDINEIINKNKDNTYYDELNDYDDNYHIRLKGMSKEVIYYTVKAMKN